MPTHIYEHVPWQLGDHTLVNTGLTTEHSSTVLVDAVRGHQACISTTEVLMQAPCPRTDLTRTELESFGAAWGSHKQILNSNPIGSAVLSGLRSAYVASVTRT
jgi:hypothetical protein